MLIMTTEEIAQLLKVDIRTIQRMAKKEIYPKSVCFRVGKQYRFNKEALLEFLTSNKFALGE